MADIPISLACWDYDRMLALQDGSVKPEGVQLTYLPVMMPEPAFRMLHYREFDAAEMSLSWYVRTLFSDVWSGMKNMSRSNPSRSARYALMTAAWQTTATL